jgi:N-acetylglutamate synthase-like GNAT family acetyltransferase
MPDTIEIKLLTECPEHIPALAILWYEEIGRHWVADASIERAAERFHTHLHVDQLPLAYVACSQGRPIGMACLRQFDGIRAALFPWLGGLVVHPDYRGQQVGEKLIDAIKQQAKNFGHPMLYLLTFDKALPVWYRRLGWQMMESDELLGHAVTVMNIAL